MGYVLSAYTLNPNLLQKAIGSGDEILLDKIIQSNRQEFEDDDDDFPQGCGRPSLRFALRQLVAIGFRAATDDNQYRYAYEEICRFLGKRCFADRYDIDSLCLRETMEATPLVELPTAGDHPLICFISAAKVPAEIARIRAIDCDTDFKLVYDRCLQLACKHDHAVVLTYG